MMARSAFNTIALTGGIVGLLDGTAAVVTSGVSAQRVFQYVASGALGRSSFEGGWSSAALGVLVHFVVAFGATAVFYAASRRWQVLVRRPVLCGIGYAFVVYFFMRYVVMWLSAVSFPAFSPTAMARGLVIHVLCVGLPIAFGVRWLASSDTG